MNCTPAVVSKVSAYVKDKSRDLNDIRAELNAPAYDNPAKQGNIKPPLTFAGLAAVVTPASLGKVMTYEKADPHGVVLQMEPRGASDQETLKAMLGIPPFSRLLWNCQAAKSVGHCYHDPARYGWHDEYTRGMVAYESGDWLVTAPSVPLIERAAILRDYQLLAK